jgi:uncharacterized protein
MRKFLILFLAVLFPTTISAYSPSFSCKDSEKLKRHEQLICGSEELSKLDVEMNDLYEKNLELYKNRKDILSDIKNSQSGWLEEASGYKKESSLKNLYETQIKYLKRKKDNYEYNIKFTRDEYGRPDREEIAKEVERLHDICYDKLLNPSKDEDLSTAGMRKLTFVGYECMESLILKEIDKGFSGEYNKKMRENFQAMEKSTSDFYWAYYNENDYPSQGTMAHLLYMSEWSDTLKQMLVGLIFLNVNEGSY